MNILQQIESDFKAEMLAAQLVISEQDLSKVLIERLGNIARTHTRDVFDFFENISNVNLDRYAVIQSFRQSIYEAIPESIFHPPTLGGLGKSPEDIVAEIRLQRKKEQEARAFFTPFEQEAPYIEVYALILELMFEKKGTYDNLYHLFARAWPFIRQLSHDVALAYIYILPILNEVRGRKEWIEKCMTFILGLPVVIRDKYTMMHIGHSSIGFVTGNAVLGINTALNGRQEDGYLSWEVLIGPVPGEKANDVLPHTGFEELVDTLLEHMAPAGIFIDKKINIETAGAFTLSETAGAGRLGYTFTI